MPDDDDDDGDGEDDDHRWKSEAGSGAGSLLGCLRSVLFVALMKHATYTHTHTHTHRHRHTYEVGRPVQLRARAHMALSTLTRVRPTAS